MALTGLCCDTATMADFAKKCKITPRKGGIPYLGAIDCDVDFTDITDTTEWSAAITGGSVVLFPEGIGSKPETEETFTRLSSCKSEQRTNEVHVLNFRTHDGDLTANTDFAQWKVVDGNYENYRFFYIDCNGNIYVDVENNTAFAPDAFKLNHTIDETNQDLQAFVIELKFKNDGIVVPFKNQDVLDALFA
jgi:hypothetical protein